MPGLMPLQSQQTIKPRVLYITSRGHSGSTLLSLLVSGHSQVVSAGELKMLSNPDPQRRLCSCHRLVPSQCPFWGAVEQRVKEQVGCSLDQLLLVDGGDDTTFMRHNEALFTAIAQVSGSALIVDSSKSLPRLSRLLLVETQGAAFALHPVHLHRGPFGSMNSARKRGEMIRRSAFNYTRLFFLTRERLQGVDALRVYYERLAADPRAEMARVMAWLQLPLEDGQFHWRDGVRRDIHGNEMRFGSSDQIRVDQSWRQQLTWAQKLGVLVWTLPVRLRSRWVFERTKRLIEPGLRPFP
ncbi:sulfotransferase protein family [Synechococcus sp. MEDNS5]|uniref:sulfotransferase n=1 Tax=Synechococcus sp. MEDNS5 TaxID=1442554 RepID=UPI0016482326|nr:sulfotransferase [Synechococcus sp. MEDNS5]QNJ04945.1 sulfotransferase protein family [Synechococcus sp. MEDNS5]